MPDTIGDLAAEVMSFVDVTQAEAVRSINRRHRTMVSRARSLRKLVELGPTVVGQAFYAAPTGVSELLSGGLRVGGVPYSKGRREDVNAYAQGSLSWRGPGGLAVTDTNAAGVRGLTFIPPPDTDGLSIELYAAMFPADLLAADQASLLSVDPDCWDILVEAAAATHLRRQGEGNPDNDDARFDAKCEELRNRVSRRFRSGPSQIRVRGINA